jgi:hypothetical protein
MINVPTSGADVNLWNVPNVLSQKFPGPAFTVTAKLRFTARSAGDQTGLAVLGRSYSAIVAQNTGQGLRIRQLTRQNADRDGAGAESPEAPVQGDTIYLRAAVGEKAMVSFFYSLDGREFYAIGTPFQATAGAWIGAKVGIFAIGTATHGEFGYADYDWIRFERY